MQPIVSRPISPRLAIVMRKPCGAVSLDVPPETTSETPMVMLPIQVVAGNENRLPPTPGLTSPWKNRRFVPGAVPVERWAINSSTVSGEKHGGTRFVEDLYGCFHS